MESQCVGKMVCIFIALFQSNDSSKRRIIHQEQFGAQYFAQGHFDMQLAGIQTGDLPITRRPALPIEPQPPQLTTDETLF